MFNALIITSISIMLYVAYTTSHLPNSQDLDWHNVYVFQRSHVLII